MGRRLTGITDGLVEGLSVPLGEVQVVDGVVNPPTSGAAYVVAGYGDPHGSGTVYVAMHSGRGVEAAGNALIDVDAGQARVSPGDALHLDGVAYRVNDVRLLDKAVLPDESDLWVPVDGRLVLFTCLQRPEGRSIQNVVIIAERESDRHREHLLGEPRSAGAAPSRRADPSRADPRGGREAHRP